MRTIVITISVLLIFFLSFIASAEWVGGGISGRFTISNNPPSVSCTMVDGIAVFVVFDPNGYDDISVIQLYIDGREARPGKISFRDCCTIIVETGLSGRNITLYIVDYSGAPGSCSIINADGAGNATMAALAIFALAPALALFTRTTL